MIYFVCGMHRSGTSALSGLLHIPGCKVPGSILPPAKNNNETGFWESKEVVRLNHVIMAEHDLTWRSCGACPPAFERLSSRLRSDAENFMDSNIAVDDNVVLKDPRLAWTLPLWLDVARDAGHELRIFITARPCLDVANSLIARDRIDFIHAALLWYRYYANLSDILREERYHIFSFDEI